MPPCFNEQVHPVFELSLTSRTLPNYLLRISIAVNA
jgi:hypothetical protein